MGTSKRSIPKAHQNGARVQGAVWPELSPAPEDNHQRQKPPAVTPNSRSHTAEPQLTELQQPGHCRGEVAGALPKSRSQLAEMASACQEAAGKGARVGKSH